MAQAFRTQNLRLLASILDANDNELIKSPSPVASAVNELTITNAATSVSPSISATGDDTNIGLNLISKGTGLIQINGKAISLANSFTTIGNFSLAFTTTGNTSLTLPTSGTLAITSQIPTVYDNTLTLAGSGGVSVSATPTFTANASADKTITITIADAALTLAKLANIGGSTILGNSAPSSAGAPAALSVATVASMLSNQTMNIVGTATSVTDIVLVAKGGTGVATANANTIFVGPSTGAAAGPSFRAMVTADIPTGIVTYDKIQYVANTARVLGRISSLSGEIEELNGANIVTIIDTNAVSRATNLAGGIAGQIPYQSGANTTLFSAAGALSQVLLSGAAGAPTWASQSTLSVGSATTAGSVTNALTISSPLTGTSYNGSSAVSIGLQDASATLAGGVSIGTQTFAGNKTFKDSVIVSGDLTVNGTTITINSSTLSVDDKNIELGAVIAIASLSSTSDITATSNIVNVASTSGLIVGQALTKTGGTGAFGASPVIDSIVSATQFTVTPVHATTGSIIFSVSGATDITADTGGITLKGATNKTFNWLNATSSWTSSENLDIVTGKTYKINNVAVLSATTLGSSVVNSSLTSVGTLVNLTVTNTITGSVSGSAASLSTSHTFWGQTFNGTQDVSGNLTSVGNITGSSGITITAGGSNQNVVLTPTGTGYTLLNGSVGIGNSTPNNKLTIQAGDDKDSGPIINLGGTNVNQFESGRIRFTEAVTGASPFYQGAYLHYDGSNNLFHIGVHDDANSLIAGDTNAISIVRSGGNVGIGTTVPGTSLEVYAIPATSTTLRQMLIINTDFASATGAGFGGSIVFRGRTPGNLLRDNAQISAYNEDIGDNGYALGFYTRPSDGGGLQQRLTILRAGNVGIGITTPVAKLHIVTTGTNDGIILDGSSNPIFVHRTSGSDRTYLSTVTSAGAFFTDASQYDFIIRSQANNILFGRGSGTSTMAVVGSNVGIGTIAPVAKLHINSTTSGATLLRTDGTNGTLFSVVDDLSDSLMSVNNSAGLPVFEVFADDRIVAGQYGQNDFVVINNKVGLGANSPINKLSVIGSASIGDSTYNVSAPANGLIVQGNVGIGNTAPAYKLDVAGSAYAYNYFSLLTAASYGPSDNSATIQVFGSTGSGGLTNTIKFVIGGNEKWRITNAGILQSTGAQTIKTDGGILTLATSTDGHIVLSPHGNGNVGIGTATPGAGLDVSKGTCYIGINGNDTFLYLRGYNTGRSSLITNAGASSNYNGLAIITNETNANSLPSWRMDIGGFDGISYGTDNFWIGRTPSGGSLLRFLFINNSGYVGIGITSPAATLDVNGTTFLRGNLDAGRTASLNSTVAVNGTGGGNREFVTFTGASTTGFTGTDNADQGYGYFAATIVLGKSYEVSATMVVTNGATLDWITSTALSSPTIPVQMIQLTPVSNTIYRFTATGDAAYVGLGFSRASGTMTAVVSNFSIKEVSILVTSNSNVGIVTTSPTNTLDVNGSARVRSISASASQATKFLTTDANGVLISRTNAEVRSDIGAGTGNGTVTSVTASTPLAATAGNAPVISLSGIVPIANGGTGAATAQLAINALAGAVTTAQFLRGDGTNILMSAIQVADVPTLNQNTSGTAAGLSAVLAIASGGTGAATAPINTIFAGPSSGSTAAPSFRAMVSADIPTGIVSYSKIQNVNPNTVLGRITNSAGIVEELSGADIATIIGSSAITNASNVTIATDDSTASSYYLYFGANITGNTPLKASTKIRYNPSTGAFSATTKSFRIPHPTKLEHDLVYGSLESPYHGVRLTGKGKTKGNRAEIFLPDYIKSLIDEETVNIQLTTIKCAKILYIENIIIDDNKFTVKYDKPWYEKCKDIEFYWDFTAERKDVPKLIVEEKI